MDRIKIAFPLAGGVETLCTMRDVQDQFFASTGMTLAFEGWYSYDVAIFRVYSHFI